MKLTSFTNLVFFYISVRLFVDGMEEFLIQPTAWYYAEYLGQSDLYLGFLLAAFSAGTLVFAPCIGALDVRFNVAKMILLLCGVTKFIGNVFYTIAANEFLPLLGRFLSGIGEGTVGVLYGAVAQGTNDINRPLAYLYFEGLYSIGTSVGPMVGSFLTFKVNIFGWKINAGNSPGLILTIIWFLLLILTVFLPNNLTGKKSSNLQEVSIDISDQEDNVELQTEYTKEYSYSRICCLYFALCQSWVLLNVGLFYIPLLAVHLFDLGLLQIKLIYVNGALFSFVLFLASYVFSGHVSEKTFIVLGIVSHVLPLSILFYFALSWGNIHSLENAYFLLLLITCVSVPFVIFPLISSLLSKETPINNASFYQSIAFAALHATNIVGRVVSGATFNKTAMKYVITGLSIGWITELIWFLIEYRHMFPASIKRKF